MWVSSAISRWAENSPHRSGPATGLGHNPFMVVMVNEWLPEAANAADFAELILPTRQLWTAWNDI